MERFLGYRLKILLFIIISCSFNYSIAREVKYNNRLTLLKDTLFLQEDHFLPPFIPHPEYNNPLHLVYEDGSKNFRFTEEKDKYCFFAHRDYGIRAALIAIIGMIKAGYDTPEKLIYHFSGEDQETYIQFLCINMEMKRDEQFIFNAATICKLIHLMSLFEGDYGIRGIEESYIMDMIIRYGCFTKTDKNRMATDDDFLDNFWEQIDAAERRGMEQNKMNFRCTIKKVSTIKNTKKNK